jgi:hypothetical protein
MFKENLGEKYGRKMKRVSKRKLSTRNKDKGRFVLVFNVSAHPGGVWGSEGVTTHISNLRSR